MTVVVGVDVGKANLDTSVSEGPMVRFDNTTAGITSLLRHLKEHVTTLVVCEATGGYERLLVSRLRKAEIAIHVAHPCARLREGLWLRSEDRPERCSGFVPLRLGLPGCADA